MLSVRVDKTASVHFDTNLYSVPPGGTGKLLTLVANRTVKGRRDRLAGWRHKLDRVLEDPKGPCGVRLVSSPSKAVHGPSLAQFGLARVPTSESASQNAPRSTIASVPEFGLRVVLACEPSISTRDRGPCELFSPLFFRHE